MPTTSVIANPWPNGEDKVDAPEFRRGTEAGLTQKEITDLTKTGLICTAPRAAPGS
jgi:hypothetical protein